MRQLTLFELPARELPPRGHATLPESLRGLVEAGFPGEAVTALLEAYGGVVLEVPRTPNARLVAALGEASAGWLCQHMGGCRFAVPKCYRARLATRNAALRRDFDGGASVPALVRRYDLTERQVWTVLGSGG